MVLRIGLAVADAIVNALPARLAYLLADLAGDGWRRMAPARRRLVAANLERVCAATDRPTRGRAFDALVASSFRQHARYYVELLRIPHYRPQAIDRIVQIEPWSEHEPALRSGATILVSSHTGNFEPFGTYVAAHGHRATVPIEEIKPRALYEFLRARRGGGRVNVVPLRSSRRPVIEALRRGEVVGIVGDRDITGHGIEVELFGHRTTVPSGPASLSLLTGAPIVAGRCLRIGPDRFAAGGVRIGWEPTGDRRADVEGLTRRLAARYEADIGEAPEQWWGAFQRRWPDVTGAA
jgi:phosphatidylinositol dimannoside acyltransferase